MTLFRQQFRVESSRLPDWDYASAGWYFVTTCTRDHTFFLGALVGDEVRLSEAGRIVDEEWHATEATRPYVHLDEFVIMPNHVHGIVILDDEATGETSHRLVSTSTPRSGSSAPKAGTLSSIVGQFKSVCTKRIWATTGHRGFAWQPSFYDHVIRSDESLARIREYIRSNPTKWETDKYYIKRL